MHGVNWQLQSGGREYVEHNETCNRHRDQKLSESYSIFNAPETHFVTILAGTVWRHDLMEKNGTMKRQ